MVVLSKALNGYSTVLIIGTADNLIKNSIDVVKELLKTHDSGVMITVNQPYTAINKIFKKNKVNVDKLFFVDCITKTAVQKSEKEEGVLFISSPSALTEIGMGMTEALESLKGKKKFVFIDSLGTFLIYNSSGSISKFSHFLITKMSIMGVDGIFMSVEKEMDEKLISELQSFCEKTITLK